MCCFPCSTFNWTVPFCSYLMCIIFTLGTIVLYLVPLKFLLLAWGKLSFLTALTLFNMHWKNHAGIRIFRKKFGLINFNKIWDMEKTKSCWIGLLDGRGVNCYLSLPFCLKRRSPVLVVKRKFIALPCSFVFFSPGINKFTKKIRKPNAVDNNELADFLSRIPSDVEIVSLLSMLTGFPFFLPRTQWGPLIRLELHRCERICVKNMSHYTVLLQRS